MANWFQCDSNLAQKPEIRQIRRSTRVEKSTIVGRLVMLWAIVDQFGDLIDEHERLDGTDLDGLIPGYTIEDLEDEIGGDRIFWDAVCDTGWLYEHDSGLMVPGFERRFSTNTKRRSEASRRKQRQRNRDQGVTGTSIRSSRTRVTDVTPPRDKNVTRGEERREEENIPPRRDETATERPGNRGRKHFWQQLCDPDGDGADQLRTAVRKRDAKFFSRAWSEAVAAGWVADTLDERRKFLGAAFHVCHPPTNMQPIRDPPAVLRSKLIERNWKTGNMQGEDDDFAREMSRRLDGSDQQPRSSSLDSATPIDTGLARDTQVARLRKLAGVAR